MDSDFSRFTEAAGDTRRRDIFSSTFSTWKAFFPTGHNASGVHQLFATTGQTGQPKRRRQLAAADLFVNRNSVTPNSGLAGVSPHQTHDAPDRHGRMQHNRLG